MRISQILGPLLSAARPCQLPHFVRTSLPRPESTKPLRYSRVLRLFFLLFVYSFILEARLSINPPGLSMHATRACRRAPLFATAGFLRCRPTSHNFVHRSTRSPLSSHRNVSTSTPLRAAQYTRFEDDPNRPPPPFRGFQTRDVIIYTLGAGSIIYYFIQYRHHSHSP